MGGYNRSLFALVIGSSSTIAEGGQEATAGLLSIRNHNIHTLTNKRIIYISL